MRGGIRALVEKIDGVVVVGEAGKGKDVLELVAELKPNLMLLDLTMPEGGGFEVLGHLRKNFPEILVIVLTVHEAVEYAARAMREGAKGFLPKSAAPTQLEQAIQTVLRGEIYISPLITMVATPNTELLDKLSRRQREVLRLVAEGLTTKQIGEKLGIAAKTAETHRAKLMERLGIYDVAGLTRFAISVGLIDVE